MISLARNSDSKEIIRLINAIYEEYGDRVCLEDAEADLLDIEKNYFSKGGAFWIYRKNGNLSGTVAARPGSEKTTVWLKRMYVIKEYRRSGIASEMLETYTQWAIREGYLKIALWSDTRFFSGHAFYEKHGFIRGPVREMFDSFVPYKEYYFEKILADK